MSTFLEKLFGPRDQLNDDLVFTSLPLDQFVPAEGWLAVRAYPDDFSKELTATPVVGWGVVRSGRLAGVFGVIRTENGTRFGIAERDWGVLVGYCRVGEDYETMFGHLAQQVLDAEYRMLSDEAAEALAEARPGEGNR